MDAIRNKKSYRVLNLELSSDALSTADTRFLDLEIPKWIDLAKQAQMISYPRSLKTHDWKQVSNPKMFSFVERWYFWLYMYILCLFKCVDWFAGSALPRLKS